MGVNQPPAFMSANMNMTVTIFGFVLSALFMLIICCRLLCFRFNSRDVLGATRHRTNFVDRALQGLEPSTVASFPTIKYNHQIFVSSEDNLCTICLGEYEEKEVLRVLPRCGHAFHVVCIDVWLRQHPTCPVCRVSLQAFPEWRRVSGQLISLAARTRFAAGAIPDTLFEQPRGAGNVLITRLPKESMGDHKESLVHSERVSVDLAIGNAREILPCYLHPSRPMTARHKGCVEMAESSVSRQQDLVADAEKPPHKKMVVMSFESFCTKDKVQTGTSAFKGEELSAVSQP